MFHHCEDLPVHIRVKPSDVSRIYNPDEQKKEKDRENLQDIITTKGESKKEKCSPASCGFPGGVRFFLSRGQRILTFPMNWPGRQKESDETKKTVPRDDLLHLAVKLNS